MLTTQSAKIRFEPHIALTEDLFLQLCRANPDQRLERTSLGELIVMSPTGSDSGARNMELLGQLHAWSKSNGLGRAFDSATGFTLPNRAIRSPDASWIARERYEALTPAQRQGFAPLCPDFVVELRSPTDTLRDLREKMMEYRDQGARLGWLIDPIRRAVEIYRPGLPAERLENPTTLPGEEVLPGFVLDLREILAP